MAAKSWDDLCEGFCPGGGQLATSYTFGHFQHKHLHQQAAASQARQGQMALKWIT